MSLSDSTMDRQTKEAAEPVLRMNEGGQGCEAITLIYGQERKKELLQLKLQLSACCAYLRR